MDKIRVALIGNGNICRGPHVRQYLEMTDSVEVVALCDILIERSEAFKRDFFPNADVYEHYEDVLVRDDIDAVDICTPNYLHSIIAVAALKAGKHVFCEKPDAVSVEEAEKMKKAAEESGKVLMVMRNNRHLPTSEYMKQYIADGKAGEIYTGRCGWIRRRGVPGKGGWFTTKAMSGGGPLIDLGVHVIDLSMWLMGNPTPVSVTGCTYSKFADNNVGSDHTRAKTPTDTGIFDVEDLATGFIKFDNGASLQIEFSWASNIKEDRKFVELRGTKAGFSWHDNELEIYTEENGQVVDVVPRFSTKKVSGHGMNLLHFYDVIRNGTTPDFVPQQGLNMIKILTAIYKSAETGKEVLL